MALTGCSQNQSASVISIDSAKPVLLEQSGSSIKLRVIALANGSAEIVSALGFKSTLIGRDIASTDADLANIPIVNSGHQIIAETVISLAPDLVLIDASSGPASAIASIRKAGISISMITESWTLSDIARKVGDVAGALGAPERGVELNSTMAQQLASITPAQSSKARIAFLYLRGTSAIYLMGGKGSGADALIAAAGGVDVGATTLPNPFNSMTSEVLATSNPDILLLMTKGLESVGGKEALLALPGIAQTSAGKAQRIITVDDSLLLSFGPRTPNLVLKLHKAIDQVLAQ
jgi:iron complex transport system substrate-binding protein